MAENNFNEVIIGPDGEFEKELPAAVLDTSFFAAAILGAITTDESKEAAEYVRDIISKNGQIVVPQLFWFEIGNVLLNAAKPKKDGTPARITKAQQLMIEELLGDLPVYTDFQPDTVTKMRIREYAENYGLTYYDAAYLELAVRKELPLKTFDKLLLSALNEI